MPLEGLRLVLVGEVLDQPHAHHEIELGAVPEIADVRDLEGDIHLLAVPRTSATGCGVGADEGIRLGELPEPIGATEVVIVDQDQLRAGIERADLHPLIAVSGAEVEDARAHEVEPAEERALATGIPDRVLDPVDLVPDPELHQFSEALPGAGDVGPGEVAHRLVACVLRFGGGVGEEELVETPVEMLPADLDREGPAVFALPLPLLLGPPFHPMRPTDVAPSQVLPVGGAGVDEEVGWGLEGIDHVGRFPLEMAEGVGHGVTWAGVAG